MKHLLTFLFILCAETMTAQPQATKLSPGEAPDGITYYLPKTAIRFHLLVEKITYTPGDYAKYAEKYMKLTDVALDPSTRYALADVALTTFGVRDTSKCYVVKMKKSDTTVFSLNEEGVLVAINDDPLQRQERTPFQPAKREPVKDPHDYLPAEMLSAGSVAKMAELTAQLIYELQERRLTMITGDAEDLPQDEGVLRLAINKIEEERQALMSLFTGTIHRDTTEHILELCPDKAIDRQILFRLSKYVGLVDADDLSGAPYYLSIRQDSPATYPLPINKKQEGIYVAQPGIGIVSLEADKQCLGSFRLPFAQFGFTELHTLPQPKQGIPHIKLHPATGKIMTTQY